ncbi:cell division protein FtsZ [Sphingosinicella sp. BN140058]|uniref:cell division protein FtsZ n=1 Tax=Sphingosinicella sp. BN140058 TaxID=1892855 RepID=UPI001011FBAC|nr:cell division protein FtsZ [Sphingosinicella sp. BN140058]QAY76600.1 cell division protein FtsZ [Sphingosinicella sp. BN140058]
MFDIDPRPNPELRPRICVIGVGGAGGNAVANMVRGGVEGVDFVVANTDAQALNVSPADTRIQLGRGATQGLGAGAQAEVGRIAAEESIEEIEHALEGAHMCFVAAGMGGGTGTGAAPVIAAAARAKGILTIGVVTKPFAFEGRKRSQAAEQGLEALKKSVDTLIVIPNQNLFRVASPDTTFRDAFRMADEVLEHGVRSITDLIMMPGVINLDFADIRAIMSWMGKAMLGTGEASGPHRAIEAAEAAIANPLLDGAIDGAKGLIISITGGDDMRLMEIDEAANHIKNVVDADADIIWGSSFLPELEGRIRVSVVATGIESAVVQSEGKPHAAADVQAPAVKSFAPSKSAPQRPAAPAPVTQASAPAPAQQAPQPPIAAMPTTPIAPPAPLNPPASVLAPPEHRPIATAAPAAPAIIREAEAQRMWVTPGKIAAPASRLDSKDEGRGASLFERMAGLARGGRRVTAEPAATIEDPSVYRRRPLVRHQAL